MQNKIYIRDCSRCKQEFESQVNTCYCPSCYKEIQRARYHKQKIGRIPKPMGRKPYPLDPESARLRFLNRRKEIEKIKVRAEWQELIRSRFTNLLTNEIKIYEWATRSEPDSYYEKNRNRILQKYKESKEVDKSKDE